MGDMLNKKFGRGRGGVGVPTKKRTYLRAISPSETARIFFVGKGVSAPHKLCNYSKKM